jgi:predicted amidophosphoribosyltransferase
VSAAKGPHGICELCGDVAPGGLCARCTRQIDADDGRPILCMPTDEIAGERLPVARAFKVARGRVA